MIKLEVSKNITNHNKDMLSFVLESFPWGVKGTALENESGPDDWHIDIMNELKNALEESNSPKKADESIRIAVAAGHSSGKTVFASWLILWFISTRINPQIIVTASNEYSLNKKTWKELKKWYDLFSLKHLFKYDDKKLFLIEDPHSWCAHAIKSNSEPVCFARCIADDTLVIFDESIGIEDVIWKACEGIAENTSAIWVCLGSPIRKKDMFYKCFNNPKHKWLTKHVDSRETKNSNKNILNHWVNDYGEDSDFVRVRVRGVFPNGNA